MAHQRLYAALLLRRSAAAAALQGLCALRRGSAGCGAGGAASGACVRIHKCTVECGVVVAAVEVGVVVVVVVVVQLRVVARDLATDESVQLSAWSCVGPGSECERAVECVANVQLSVSRGRHSRQRMNV
eukprot:1157940-Pelagomonas_calceolata.AAC.7